MRYVAPECLNGFEYYSEKSDIWACGVIAYALLSGKFPYDGKSPQEILSKLSRFKCDFDDGKALSADKVC